MHRKRIHILSYKRDYIHRMKGLVNILINKEWSMSKCASLCFSFRVYCFYLLLAIKWFHSVIDECLVYRHLIITDLINVASIYKSITTSNKFVSSIYIDDKSIWSFRSLLIIRHIYKLSNRKTVAIWNEGAEWPSLIWFAFINKRKKRRWLASFI